MNAKGAGDGGGDGKRTEPWEVHDTSTDVGRAQLMDEAVESVNRDTEDKKGKLRQILDTAYNRPQRLRQLLRTYQAQIQRWNGDILSIVKTGAEGQENLDLAKLAAKDMEKRIQTYSAKAGELKTYVDEFRKQTRPLELAQAHVVSAIDFGDKLAALATAVRGLRDLSFEESGGRGQYYDEGSAFLAEAMSIWEKLKPVHGHKRLENLQHALTKGRETLTMNARAEFKNAQRGLARQQAPDATALSAAARCVEAVAAWRDAEEEKHLVLEIVEGYCDGVLSQDFVVRWAPVGEEKDAQWTNVQFQEAIGGLIPFLEQREVEIRALFPESWGVVRHLSRMVLQEARGPLRERVATRFAQMATMNYEFHKMRGSAREIEREVVGRWAAATVKYSAGDLGPLDWCISEVFEFLDAQGGPGSAAQPEASHAGENGEVGEGEDGGGVGAVAVFDLADLDAEPEIGGMARVAPMLGEAADGEGEAGDDGRGEVLCLDAGGGQQRLEVKIRAWDWSVLCMESLQLCTVLAAGLTSYGQAEGDRQGLRTVAVQMEIARRSSKAMLLCLDAPNSAEQQELVGNPDNAELRLRGEGGGVPPFSLRYRLMLLKFARQSRFVEYKVQGTVVDFYTWRSFQLQLVVAMARVGLGVQGGEARRGGEEEAAAEGAARWKVAEETKEYTSAQLMQAIWRLAEEVNKFKAPSPELWAQYCEGAYLRAVRRLSTHVVAVIQARPWVDSYGPLAIHLYEQLVSVACFDEFGAQVADKEAVLVMLRAVQEALALSPAIHTAALLLAALKMFLSHRSMDTLEVVRREVQALVATPPEAFAALSVPAKAGAMPQHRPSALWYRSAALQETSRGLWGLLADTHGNFINDPVNEIRHATEVFLSCERGLNAGPDDENQGRKAEVTERQVSAIIRVSIQTRFSIVRGSKANEEGKLDIESCIQVITDLVEEVDGELEFYIPGFSHHFDKAPLVALLQYTRCCDEEIQDVVKDYPQYFRSLKGETVRLWRALHAFSEKVMEVLPPASKEGDEATVLFQMISSRFDGCVRAWIDEQTEKYHETLNNGITLERQNKWQPLPHSGVSSSAVDLFQMLHESVPQLFSLGLPITREHAMSLVGAAGNVDLIIMQYCNTVMTHYWEGKTYPLNPEVVKPKFVQKKDNIDKFADKIEEVFTAEGRQAARARKEMNKAAKGQEVKESHAEKMKKFFTIRKSGDAEEGKKDAKKAASHVREKSQGEASGHVRNKSEGAPEDSSGDMLSKMEKKVERIFGGPSFKDSLGADPVELLPPVDPRLEAQGLPTLYVRLKNLEWCRGQAQSLEQDVLALWEKEATRRCLERSLEGEALEVPKEGDPLGELLVPSQLALQTGIRNMTDYIAAKVVFFNLRDIFVARLYFPQPSARPLTSFLAQDGELDRVLTEMSGEFLGHDGFGELLWGVLEKICANIVKAVEWSLVGDQMGSLDRKFTPEEDASVVLEDMVALKQYFIQKDEEGNTNGLDEEVVASKISRMEILANQLLQETTDDLLSLYYDKTTPERDDKSVVTRESIAGALARRQEKAAKDFTKEHRRKKKAAA